MGRNSSIFRGGLYRSRKGIIFGVCRGFADYFDVSVFWVRAIVVIIFIFTGFWPVTGLYILAALLMKSEPAMHIRSRSNHVHDRRYAGSAHDTANRLKRKWHRLEMRIRRMEDNVTSREFKWNKRFQER